MTTLRGRGSALRRGLVAATALVPVCAAIADEDDRKLRDRQPPYVGPGMQGASAPRDGMIGPFSASNVTLYSWLPLGEFPGDHLSAAMCWGYVSPSGREYAIIGLHGGFGFVEITDPSNPVILTVIPGARSLWHDVRVMGQYAYGVSEGGLGIQIMDLSQIDDGVVTLVRNKTHAGHSSTHTIISNPDSGYLYLNGSNIANGGLVAVSTATPSDPTIVGAWSGRYVHESQVVTYSSGPYAGREIAFCFNGGAGLEVIDVTNKSAMTRIGGTGYSGVRYCHQGWLDDARQYLYVNDEMDEGSVTSVTTTHVFNVANPASPSRVATFTTGLPSTDHNLYIRGNLLFEANYKTGLRVFDLSTSPTNPAQIAWLDTHPSDDSQGYHGAWGNFPFFPSGSVIVSDIERGLFVLRVGVHQLEFSYPQGLPATVLPGVGTTVSVAVAENGAALDPASVTLHASIDGEPPVAVPMSPNGDGTFSGAIPGADCHATVEFWFSARDTGGATHVDPWNAPISPGHFADVLTSVETVAEYDFESDAGWTVSNTNVSNGPWERGVPNGGGTNTNPPADFDASGQCWVTGLATGSHLVGGPTHLISPVLDLSGAPEARLAFAAYFWRSFGLGDWLRVDLSNDGGATWVNIDAIPPDGAWVERLYRVADYLAPTASVRIQFRAENVTGIVKTEAAVDALRVLSYECRPCVADYNRDGEVNTIDFVTYLNDFTGATSLYDPDMNGDGEVNTLDFVLYLNAFNTGCE